MSHPAERGKKDFPNGLLAGAQYKQPFSWLASRSLIGGKLRGGAGLRALGFPGSLAPSSLMGRIKKQAQLIV